MRHATFLQRTAALVVAWALVVAPVGCTSAQRVDVVSTTPPSPDAEDVEIHAVRTAGGESIAFSRPAVIGTQDGVQSLFGRKLTEYQGEQAEQLLRLDLAEIESYEYSKLETRPNNLKTAGAILGITLLIAAIVVGHSASGIGNAVACAFSQGATGAHSC